MRVFGWLASRVPSRLSGSVLYISCSEICASSEAVRNSIFKMRSVRTQTREHASRIFFLNASANARKNTWTGTTQMQTQVQLQAQGMKNFPFLALAFALKFAFVLPLFTRMPCVCAFICVCVVRVNQAWLLLPRPFFRGWTQGLFRLGVSLHALNPINVQKKEFGAGLAVQNYIFPFSETSQGHL